MVQLAKVLRFLPELKLLESLYLYRPGVTPLPNDDEGSRWLRFESHGTVVRFQEDSFAVHLVVEGAIGDAEADGLVNEVWSPLSGIDKASWTAFERRRWTEAQVLVCVAAVAVIQQASRASAHDPKRSSRQVNPVARKLPVANVQVERRL